MNSPCFTFEMKLPIRASHAGLYVCPGEGRHEVFRRDTFELIFVKKGCLEMFEEQRRFKVQPGETLLLWPKRRHGGIGNYPPDTQFFWLHFTPNPPAGVSKKNGVEIGIPQIGTPQRPERLVEMFHRYLHEFEGRYFPGPAADLLVCDILAEAALQRAAAAPGKNSLAAKAKALMDSGFHKNLSPGKIATELGYSLEYLANKFRAAYNQTLSQYLLQRQLEEARLLLRDSTRRIKEIATLCGFSSEQYFCRVFRKSEGISPSDYRALHVRISINVR